MKTKITFQLEEKLKWKLKKKVVSQRTTLTKVLIKLIKDFTDER